MTFHQFVTHFAAFAIGHISALILAMIINHYTWRKP